MSQELEQKRQQSQNGARRQLQNGTRSVVNTLTTMGDNNGESNSLKVFSYMVGIPYDTFKKYVCDDEEKHCKVGNGVG
jgi:hypothetical protein